MGGGAVGRVGWGGARDPVTSPCPPSGVGASARVRVGVMGRVRCRVRSTLRVGVGVRVKVAFKYSAGVFQRLGGEGCSVGKGNEKKIFGRLWGHHMYG